MPWACAPLVSNPAKKRMKNEMFKMLNVLNALKLLKVPRARVLTVDHIVFPLLYFVGIALLDEEELPVHPELLFLGIAGDQGVEMRLGTVGLGTQHAAESLGFFLAAAEGPGNLDEHVGV